MKIMQVPKYGIVNVDTNLNAFVARDCFLATVGYLNVTHDDLECVTVLNGDERYIEVWLEYVEGFKGLALVNNQYEVYYYTIVQ